MPLHLVGKSTTENSSPGTQDVGFYFDCAIDSLNRCDSRAAVRNFNKCLKLNPRHAPALLSLAQLRFKQHKYTESAALCRRALEIDPGYPLARYQLAFSLQKIPGRRQEAVGYYLRTLELWPRYADAHLNLAMLLDELKSYSRAIVYFRKFLKYSDGPGENSEYAQVRIRELASMLASQDERKQMGLVRQEEAND